jgi:hypothetical protein
LDPSYQVVQVHGPGLAGYFSSVFEDDQGGNALDSELAGQHLFRLGVHLGQADPRLKARGGLLVNGGHRLAGPAPGGPEINDHRDSRTGDGPLKSLLSEFHRVGGKQVFLALAAFGMVAQPVPLNPIHGAALGTGDFHGLLHFIPLHQKTEQRTDTRADLEKNFFSLSVQMLRRAFGFESFQFPHKILKTFGTQSMGKVQIHVLFKVALQLRPVLLVIANLLALGANGNHPADFFQLGYILYYQEGKGLPSKPKRGGGNQDIDVSSLAA